LWPTVNIGGTGHTPGAVQVFKGCLPADTNVIRWPSSVDNGGTELIKRYFPRLIIIQGNPATPELKRRLSRPICLYMDQGRV